jgi:preprotein translocase subunit YajC
MKIDQAVHLGFMYFTLTSKKKKRKKERKKERKKPGADGLHL